MKKFTLYVAGLLAVLTLVSCHALSSQPLQSQPSESAPAQTGFWADPGEVFYETYLPEGECSGFPPPGHSYSDLGAFEDYISSTALPKRFVPYEAISALGTFQKFTDIGYPDELWYDYTYTLVGEPVGRASKFELTFRPNIVEPGVEVPELEQSGDKIKEDARFIDEDGVCRILWQGVEWHYRDGRLYFMILYFNGNQIYLSGYRDKYLAEYEYAPDSTSLMSRLLTKSEAPYALAEFAAALTAEKQAEG